MGLPGQRSPKLVSQVPFLQGLFGTFPLTPLDWAIVVGGSATIVPVLETAKWMERKGWFGKLD